MSVGVHHRPSKKSTPPSGVALALLQAIDGGITSATLLAEKFEVSKQRISYLLIGLIKAGLLRKDGKDYALSTKAKKSTALAAQSIAFEAASVKDSQASEPPTTQVPQTAKNAKNANSEALARHAAQPPKTRDFHILSRQDWVAYTSPNTISQKTGLAPRCMVRSDLKELVDNGLDHTDRHRLPGLVTLTQHDSHTFTAANKGPGWDLSPEEFAYYFSLARDAISSKLWRELNRGALGEGLMSIVGSVAYGGGRIIISTCNRRIVLRPHLEDGTTTVEEVANIDFPEGTAITIEIDPAYPKDPGALRWAQTAIDLARNSNPPYRGRSSVHWFDTDAFSALLRAVGSRAPGTTLREFLTKFDGCSSTTLRQKIAQLFGPKCRCRQLDRDQAAQLLRVLQSATKPVKPKRLVPMGSQAWPYYSDGYHCEQGYYVTGARAPLAKIPCLIECWTDVEPFRDEDPRLDWISINRSPGIISSDCERKRGREVTLHFNYCSIDLSLPRADIEFALNITAPFIPILSSMKSPDFNPFSYMIKKAIEIAVNRGYRTMRRRSVTVSVPKDPPLDPVTHEAGPLHRVLENAVSQSGFSIKELTVLSKDRDPYLLDTLKGNRNGQWFAEMIERFLGAEGTVHLRGFHYLLSSSAHILLPDGRPYINDDDTWEWLSDKAAKAARWLDYVSFERIVDERNAPAELYLPPYFKVEPKQEGGEPILVPSLDDALPRLSSDPWPIVQPCRIIFLGEKVSLKKILLPITQMVGGELLLPTGETSDTMIAELAGRCSLDSRPSVVLYFSDFDPSGYQMPVSFTRKLQALRDLRYPELDIRVHHVALTLDQVRQLGLPSTPLKPTEKRADRWRQAMQHEQTEIDALAALRPEQLRIIALEAIKPFYDPALVERVRAAQEQWKTQCSQLVSRVPGSQEARASIELVLETACRSAEELAAAQLAASSLLEGLEPPPIELPKAQINPAIQPPTPLFNSRDTYVEATLRLIERKKLVGVQDTD
jgi:hypothetical protein